MWNDAWKFESHVFFNYTMDTNIKFLYHEASGKEFTEPWKSRM